MEFTGDFARLDPRRADLERLRRHAKDLQRAYNLGNDGARDLVACHLPKGAEGARLKLAYAQFVIARVHGFSSWPRLKAYVEARQIEGSRLRDAALESAFDSNDFRLDAIHQRRGELDTSDISVAAVLADVDALRKLIAVSPSLVAARGGPRDCPPLVYLCHSRFGALEPDFGERQVKAVRLLLSSGADANAATPGDEHGHALSALYGSVKSPGHPELCQLLLEHGARASDGESLYHASELQDLRCLALLLAHGPDEADREWCIARMIDHDHPEGLRLYLEHGTSPDHLCRALFRERSIACLRLLIDYGANVDEVCEEDWLLKRVSGLTPVRIAERSGYDDAVALLLASGAADNREPRDLLIGACARGNRAEAERMLAIDAKLIGSLTPNDHSYLAAFARAGNRQAVEIMLDAGFDIEAKADDMICSGLVYAATNGDVSMLRLLLERGADIEACHKHGGNALGTAIYCAANFRNPGGDYAGAVDLVMDAGLRQTAEMLPFALDHGLDDVAEALIAHGGEPPDEPA